MIRMICVAFPKLPGFGDGRKNDGSYFFLDEKSAEAALMNFRVSGCSSDARLRIDVC